MGQIVKDYVFIGWCNDIKLAKMLKKKIDETGSCAVIGGDYANNPEDYNNVEGTVNSTIEYQINHCNQFIFLIQKKNKDDEYINEISSNIIYELGYVRAKSCYSDFNITSNVFFIDVPPEEMEMLMPTNTSGMWKKPIFYGNRDDEQVVNEIFELYETRREKNSVSHQNHLNKFALINNVPLIERELEFHKEKPSISDYDLAHIILSYVQAAFCFQNPDNALAIINSFSERMHGSKSCGLNYAVDFAKISLDLFCRTIPSQTDMKTNMDKKTYLSFTNRYIRLARKIVVSTGIFDDVNIDVKDIELTKEMLEKNYLECLILAHIQEHLSFLVLVYYLSDNIQERENIAKRGIEYCIRSENNLLIAGENNCNDKEFSDLLLSYVYYNISVFYKGIGNTEKHDIYVAKSLELREYMYDDISDEKRIYNPALCDYISLEYYNQLVEEPNVLENLGEMKELMIEEIDQYIKRRNVSRNRRYLLFDKLVESFKKYLAQYNYEN